MWEIILTAAGLAADAFAVSVCKGLSTSRVTARHMLTAGLYFGIFQALMPVLGYLLGEKLCFAIESIDHWIAFSLLFLIGFSMLYESFQKGEKLDDAFDARAMLPLALSTSIDALAAGITFSIESIDIRLAAGVIGVVTAVLCAVGIRLGNLFGTKCGSAAQALGGCTLIFMGIKILISHITQ